MKKHIIIVFALLFVICAVSPFFADDQEFFSYSVKPYIWIIFDTSGSMIWNMGGSECGGDGSKDHLGGCGWPYQPGTESRLYICKQAIYGLLNNITIDMYWGLATFEMDSYPGGRNGDYYDCWRSTIYWRGSPNNSYDYYGGDLARDMFFIRAPLDSGFAHIQNNILPWVDQNASTNWYDPTEIRGDGGTPTAPALLGARYWVHTHGPSDSARDCRPYFIILLTDGEPTWDMNSHDYNTKLRQYDTGSPKRHSWEEAALLRNVDVGDTVIDVKTYVIGIGMSGSQTLDSIAYYGGTEQYYPANDPSQLQEVLNEIVSDIIEQSTSYSGSEVTSIQEEFITTSYEARMYLCSFVPSASAVWDGHLKAVKLVAGSWNVDSIPDSLMYWDAGDSLTNRSAATRQIYTQKGGFWTPFNVANITPADLDVATAGARDSVINTVYSGGPNGANGYLSDIFHSSPLRIFGPNYFYEDDDFFKYRNEMDTTREPMIYAGANDGMLHCFRDSTGEEMWAFIPNDQLKNLKYLLTEHRYFVDAKTMAADIWFPFSATDSFKNQNEWKTILISGERQGGRAYSALDVTDPYNPDFEFTFDTTMIPLGQTWSDPVMFKVHKDSLEDKNDRFFGFFGGGYWQDTLYDIYSPVAPVPGSGIYVFDVQGMCTNNPPIMGTHYWKIPPNPASSFADSMLYPFPSQVSVIDTNLDTYADMFYIGDWAGRLWKVIMNEYGDSSSVVVNDWEANVIFKAPKPVNVAGDSLWQPMFFPSTHAWDGRRWWLFFGTGDRANAVKENTKNRFYAIIDGDYDPPITEADLKHVPLDSALAESEIIGPPFYKGWYLEYADFDYTDSMSGPAVPRDGEKTTSYATVIMDTLVFTTYQPYENNDPCATSSGIGRLYKIHYKTGSYGNAAPSRIIGSGLPQAPRYSFSISGEGLEIINLPGQVIVQQTANIGVRRKLLWWQETH